MQYLVIFTPKQKFETEGKPSDFLQRELEEQEQTRVLYAEGGARQVWALATKNRGGVILFEADSPTHLQEMIDSFPLIRLDYADYQIWPLGPYPAFVPQS